MTPISVSKVSKTLKSQSSIIVRPAIPEDVAHVRRLHSIIRKASTGGNWATNGHKMQRDRYTAEELEVLILDPEYTLLVAFDSDTNQPLGATLVSTIPTVPTKEIIKPESALGHPETSVSDDQLVCISSLYVDPEQQFRGVGGILGVAAFQYAVDVLKRTEIIGFVLEDRPQLVEWYKSYGMKDFGERAPCPVKVLDVGVTEGYLVVLRQSLRSHNKGVILPPGRNRSSEVVARL